MASNKQLTVFVIATLALVLVLVSNETKALEPIVDVGPSPLSADGRHVAVHLPGIFDLKVDTRGEPGSHAGARISQNVLSGLVQIFIDRARSANGTMNGPIEVKLFGMDVYKNGDQPISTPDSSKLQAL